MSRSSRRTFLQTSAVAAGGFFVANSLRAADSDSPNEKVRFACIGVGGKGDSDSADAGKHGDVVAICDIDEQRLDKAAASFKDAKKFVDFRQMLEEMRDSIDAVTVSTPDHTHAPAALMAMRLGKAVYCQKPMTHSIYEARLMAQVAREKGVATQMGNQGTSESGLRKAAATVKTGVLGDVSEVHVWTNRPIWPQGGPRPEPSECPAHVKWDLWLGPAASRPYAKGYHPFAWRGWWDFGTGALGDMACHTVNLPYAALDLHGPVSVEAEHSGHNQESYPKWSIIKFEFPATDKRKALTMYWYDGGKRPPKELFGDAKLDQAGSLIVGTKGKLYSPGDYGAGWDLLGDVNKPEVEFTQSPGHFTEWVEAIKGGPAAMSNFPEYSGGLTETILLGNLALWAGKKVEWDAQNMKSPNCPELEPLIKPVYRSGWTLDV
ncbi:MAG: Gfo/Idh/MocA family oxidoreductase [Pirellulales bacterium]|nr:Gfo/Idh/MocA family oxidoreductase [Pirellulales bacterium]